VIVWVPVPTADGVYVTLQFRMLGGPVKARVQVVPGNEKAPDPLLEKVTVPAGADADPAFVS
jgi:hypothetical protein